MKHDILVIDDDDAIRKIFSLVLKKHDYSVSTAESGDTALRILEKNTYRLILLDQKMPGISGTETLRKIREKDKNVPVFIITAFQKEYFADLKKLREAGIEFQLLQKPIDTEQLLLIVNRVLMKGSPVGDSACMFKLYVIGKTKRTENTINKLHELFKDELSGKYSLEVIDILETPDLAVQDRVIATPTLIKISPEPARRVIGDLGAREMVINGLSLGKTQD